MILGYFPDWYQTQTTVTLKVQSKTEVDNILIFFFFYFSEKIRLGISCLADDSHEMPSLTFSEFFFKSNCGLLQLPLAVYCTNGLQ